MQTEVEKIQKLFNECYNIHYMDQVALLLVRVSCHAKIVPGENCTAGTIFATKIVPGGTILVAKSVPALPNVYWVVRKDR